MNIKLRQLIALSLFVVLLVIIFLIAKHSGLGVQDLLDYCPQNPFLAAFFLIFVYCIRTLTAFVPLLLLYTAAGRLFSIKYALLVSGLGLLSEMTIGYVIGYRYGSSKIGHVLENHVKIKGLFGVVRDNVAVTCFTARLLPFPLGITNLFFGSAKIPYGTYLLFSMLGSLPKLIPFVISGKHISQPLSSEFLIPFGIGLVLAIAALVIYLKVPSHRKGNEIEQKSEQ